MKGNNIVDLNDRSVVVSTGEVSDDERENSNTLEDTEGASNADQTTMTTSLPLPKLMYPLPHYNW